MVSLTPPEKRDIKFQLDWPPVKIVEREETLNEHIMMSVVMLTLTAGAVEMGMMIPAIFSAFIAGAGVSNVVNHYTVYGSGGN